VTILIVIIYVEFMVSRGDGLNSIFETLDGGIKVCWCFIPSSTCSVDYTRDTISWRFLL